MNLVSAQRRMGRKKLQSHYWGKGIKGRLLLKPARKLKSIMITRTKMIQILL